MLDDPTWTTSVPRFVLACASCEEVADGLLDALDEVLMSIEDETVYWCDDGVERCLQCAARYDDPSVAN